MLQNIGTHLNAFCEKRLLLRNVRFLKWKRCNFWMFSNSTLMKYSLTFALFFVPKQLFISLLLPFYYITTFIKTYDMRVFAKDGNCSDVTKPKNNSIYLFGLTMPFCLNLTIFFPRSLHLKIQNLRLMWHYHCSTHSSTYDRSNKREKCFNIVLFLFYSFWFQTHLKM